MTPSAIELLTNRETAALLGISERTLARWHAQRMGPPRINAGRRPKYRLSSVMKCLEANEAQPLHTFGGARYDHA